MDDSLLGIVDVEQAHTPLAAAAAQTIDMHLTPIGVATRAPRRRGYHMIRHGEDLCRVAHPESLALEFGEGCVAAQVVD